MFFLCCKIVNFKVIAESIDGHIKVYLGFSYSEAMCCGIVFGFEIVVTSWNLSVVASVPNLFLLISQTFQNNIFSLF